MFKLVQICGACPEAYNVFLSTDEKQEDCVGYMRLRHGYFYAEYRGQTVYDANPNGDGLFDRDERSRHLNLACQAIKRAMEEELHEPENIFEIVNEYNPSDDWYEYEG